MFEYKRSRSAARLNPLTLHDVATGSGNVTGLPSNTGPSADFYFFPTLDDDDDVFSFSADFFIL